MPVSDVVVTRWIAASPRRCSHSSPTSNAGLHGRVWAASRRPPWGRTVRDHAGRGCRIGTLHRGRATTANRLHLGVGGKLDSHPARILDRHDRARPTAARWSADPLRFAAGRDASCIAAAGNATWAGSPVARLEKTQGPTTMAGSTAATACSGQVPLSRVCPLFVC